MYRFYAHSADGKQPNDWHLLDEHLTSVAKAAKDFAEVFGAGDWAYLAGLWHDVGKYAK